MTLPYILKPSNFFLEQLKDLNDESARLIEKKLRLVKINPYRFKRIVGYGLFLFRIRFEEGRKEKRVVYLVDKPYVKIICILDRDKKYKDLKEYLKRLGYL
jgi:D-lyxose ketol-isomerase